MAGGINLDKENGVILVSNNENGGKVDGLRMSRTVVLWDESGRP